jgi:hypothetical protein
MPLMLTNPDYGGPLQPWERGLPESWNDPNGDNPIATFDPEEILEGTREPVLSTLDLRKLFEEEQKEPEPSVLSFFSGRTYEDGVKAYNEYLISKGDK